MKHEVSPTEQFAQAVHKLRAPAGDDPRFASHEAINANRVEFAKLFNRGHQELHLQTFPFIAAHQRIVNSFDKATDPRRKAHYRYSLQLWYRINDAIVWIMLKDQRHLIKRLWGGRTRPSLLAQDLRPVFAALKTVYAEPSAMAVWSDATSFIDAGDLLITRPGMVELRELKTGRLNDTLAAFARSGDSPAVVEEKFGKKAREQFERMIRQSRTLNQVVDLMRDERGLDPFTKQKINVIETDIPNSSYDPILDGLLRQASLSEEAIDCIDGCLWVYVSKIHKRPQAELRFLEHLRKVLAPDGRDMLERMLARGQEGMVFHLQQGAHYPVTRPIYMRNLPTADVVDICFWKTSVALYLDWVEFANLVRKNGGTFSWSSTRAGRTAKTRAIDRRPLIVLDRIPTFGTGKGSYHLGAPRLLCMYVDGQTPLSLARQEIAAAEHLVKLRGVPGGLAENEGESESPANFP